MAIVMAIEWIWWLVVWRLGLAPVPSPLTYLALAFAGLAGAITLRLALNLPPIAIPWPTAVLATVLVGLGASAFLPLKYAIPGEIGFWLDQPLALAERQLFGTDPWALLDILFGWAAVPMDWLYGCWMPVQTLALFALILARPSSAKARALVAYSLAWFLLGVVAAMLLSSAGPLFYDRLYGGNDFHALAGTLRSRGAWIALAESDLMWTAMRDPAPGIVAGISAMPSIHVAISLWMYLAARDLAPKAAPAALVYFLLVWVGSVQFGWHYVADGLVGAIGMVGVWHLARLVPAGRGRVRGRASA
jgi:hypothetical protein